MQRFLQGASSSLLLRSLVFWGLKLLDFLYNCWNFELTNCPYFFRKRNLRKRRRNFWMKSFWPREEHWETFALLVNSSNWRKVLKGPITLNCFVYSNVSLFILKQMLTESIMHDCVVKLLKSNDEESFECLCKLLLTIGKDLDHAKAKVWITLWSPSWSNYGCH